MGPLEKAAASAAGGDLVACRRGLVEAWRRDRHPRVAEVNDLVAKVLASQVTEPPFDGAAKKAAHAAWLAAATAWDARAYPRLAPGVMAGNSTHAKERIEALLTWEDPVVSALLVQCLERPAWRAQSALPFFKAVMAGLVRLRDGRVLERVTRLAEEYTAIIPTSVGELVGKALRTCAQTLAKELSPPRPLSQAEASALAAIEASLGGAAADSRREAVETRAAQRSLADMLEAVYANPDDDAARQVYADALLEHGDVRGEFITLQLLPTRSPQQHARMVALYQEHAERWSGTLGAAIYPDEFARGFLSRVSMWKAMAAVGKTAGAPGWATVETISSQSRGDMVSKLTKVLTHEVLRALRTLLCETDVVLAGLDAHPRLDAVGPGPGTPFDEVAIASRRPRWRAFISRGNSTKVLETARVDHLLVLGGAVDARTLLDAAKAAGVPRLSLTAQSGVSSVEPTGVVFEFTGRDFEVLTIHAGWTNVLQKAHQGELDQGLARMASLSRHPLASVTWKPRAVVTPYNLVQPDVAPSEAQLRATFTAAAQVTVA